MGSLPHLLRDGIQVAAGEALLLLERVPAQPLEVIGLANLSSGQDGDDTLTGGLGRDALAGMGGADRFVFTDVADSPAGAPDRVLDFSAAEHDILDLSAIDANRLTSGDEDFLFIDQNPFSGTPGELRVDQLRHHVTLQGDVDGDGVADVGITLLGVDGVDFAESIVG